MRIARDELDAGEAAGNEAAQEGRPGSAVLGGNDIEPERFAVALAVDRDGVHDAGVDRPAALAALHDQRIEQCVLTLGYFPKACVLSWSRTKQRREPLSLSSRGLSCSDDARSTGTRGTSGWRSRAR